MIFRGNGGKGMIFQGKRNTGAGKGIGKRRKHEEELICHENINSMTLRLVINDRNDLLSLFD